MGRILANIWGKNECFRVDSETPFWGCSQPYFGDSGSVQIHPFWTPTQMRIRMRAHDMDVHTRAVRTDTTRVLPVAYVSNRYVRYGSDTPRSPPVQVDTVPYRTVHTPTPLPYRYGTVRYLYTLYYGGVQGTPCTMYPMVHIWVRFWLILHWNPDSGCKVSWVHTGTPQIRHLFWPPLRSFALQRTKEGRKHPPTGPTKSGTCFAPFLVDSALETPDSGVEVLRWNTANRALRTPEVQPLGSDLAVYISLVWENHPDQGPKHVYGHGYTPRFGPFKG